VYLPVGAILYAHNNTRSFHSNSSYYDDILIRGDEEEYLRVERGKTVCLTCPEVDSKTKVKRKTTRTYNSDWSDDEDYNESDDWNTNSTNRDEAVEVIKADSIVLDSTQIVAPALDSIQISNNQSKIK